MTWQRSLVQVQSGLPFIKLKTHWSDDEIVEIMGVGALFGYLNRWNDVMATPLENDAALSAKELLASWDRGRH